MRLAAFHVGQLGSATHTKPGRVQAPGLRGSRQVLVRGGDAPGRAAQRMRLPARRRRRGAPPVDRDHFELARPGGAAGASVAAGEQLVVDGHVVPPGTEVATNA